MPNKLERLIAWLAYKAVNDVYIWEDWFGWCDAPDFAANMCKRISQGCYDWHMFLFYADGRTFIELMDDVNQYNQLHFYRD